MEPTMDVMFTMSDVEFRARFLTETDTIWSASLRICTCGPRSRVAPATSTRTTSWKSPRAFGSQLEEGAEDQGAVHVGQHGRYRPGRRRVVPDLWDV